MNLPMPQNGLRLNFLRERHEISGLLVLGLAFAYRRQWNFFDV